MNERELLELAARAGGLRIDFDKKKGEYFSIVGTPYFWNAGLNSQQAFELADHLRMMIDITDTRVRVMAGALAHVTEIPYAQHDRAAINRLAIVMTAADVQRARENAQ